jgi:hypothetical protein
LIVLFCWLKVALLIKDLLPELSASLKGSNINSTLKCENEMSIIRLFSMGYTCPATYNPADFYVQTLAVIPGLEDTSRSTVRAICDRFIVTSTAKQIDLLIQFETSLGQEMLELSTKNGHQPVGL